MESLSTLPEGVTQTDDLITQLDACFMLGFSRLGSEQTDALAALARTFAGTPLAERLVAAVEGLTRAEFREEHFVAIAAARASLQGAQYDALLQAGLEATNLSRALLAEAPERETSGPIANWMTSTRQWLLELALAGFMQLDQQNVAPFIATLEQLQKQPEAARLAMLLTGYVHELSDAIPASQLAVVPARRWVDLWCRAMISALRLPPAPTPVPVSGSLLLLGCDMRHHTNVVSAVFYGVIEGEEEGAPARFVRTSVSAYKVDLVSGEELFQALDATSEGLLAAWSGTKALELKEMPLLPTGDLLWDASKAKPGKAYDLLIVAERYFGKEGQGASVPDVMPEDRHPVQLALPVYASGYKTVQSGDEVEVDLGGASVRVDEARISALNDLCEGAFSGTKECFGLLRFDAGRWGFQPLVGTKGKKLMRAGDSATTKSKSTSTIATLQERAGRLLRKKS